MTTSNPVLRRLLLVSLALILFVAGVVFLHEAFTSRVPGANDFYSRWKGAQLFWQEGVDPYSGEATAEIQRGMYGRLARPDEDQVAFAYPFYTAILLWPLAVIQLPYSWIQAIWLTLLFGSLIGAVFLILRLLRWEMPVWLLALTTLWAILLYNSIRTVILGQFAAIVFLGIVATVFGLQRRREGMAGICLALTTIKPQMIFLLIPALMIWATGQRRWRFLTAFFGTMALLFGTSFILLPSWFEEFIGQVVHYTDYTETGSPIWIVTGYYLPQLGRPVEIGLSIALLAYLFTQWRLLPRADAESGKFFDVVILTLIITALVALRTATTNQIVLLLPILASLRQIGQRLRFGIVFIVAFYAVTLSGIWFAFIRTIDGDAESPLIYFLLPGLAIVLFIWKLRVQAATTISSDETPDLAIGLVEEHSYHRHR
ncbi:MAG: glycosyltransferase family 87 protein [Anaerolineae bacterium]|nr:glycosyltransferase family 87 protein [Anaerolineae bacterium]